MLLKSLIFGIAFSMGIFAIKSGVGAAYVVGRHRKKTKIALDIFLFVLVYGIVFAAASIVLSRVDPVAHLAAFQGFFRSGTLVHLLLAALMAAWGVALLRRNPKTASKSRGWLMLVVPCPLCVAVILLSMGFLLAGFPDHPRMVVSLFFIAFVMIALAALGVARRYGRNHPEISPESFLGSAMLLIAAYFLVSMTVMPLFGELNEVYRLARYRGPNAVQSYVPMISLAICIVTAFSVGFVASDRKIRRTI